MFIAPVDATRGEDEWRPFVTSHPFGHLVAPGGPGARSARRRAHAVRARRRHGLAASRAGQPGVRRSGREPAGAAERGRRLGLHPVVVEGDRRRGPRTRDPDDLLRRGAAGRHGDGARRADGAGQRGRRSCGASWRRSSPASTWPTRPRPTPRSCSGSSGSPSRSRRCRPSSSTAATSTSRTAGPWWSVCDERGAPGDEAAAGHVARRLGI